MQLLSVQISRSPHSSIPGEPDRKLNSGIFKQPVQAPVELTSQGIDSDHIVDKRHHGGEDQALLLYSEQDYQWWEAELQTRLPRGLFGENLLIDGWQSGQALVGDRMGNGQWLIELTAPRTPCNTFARVMRSFAGGWVDRFVQAGRPGAYARIIQTGQLAAGDALVYQRYTGEAVALPEMLRARFKQLTSNEILNTILQAPIAARDRKLFQARIDGSGQAS